VRDTFCDAGEAFIDFDWQDGAPEPLVDFEVNYVPHAIPISRACTLVWNCTAIVPGSLFDRLVHSGLDIKGRTYAACARAMQAHIKRGIFQDDFVPA
jgi:hypothetical protein